MAGTIIAILLTYFSSYPREVNKAFEFCQQNKSEIITLTQKLSKEDALTAMCIVAPEISQFSTFIDETETYALKVLYVQGKITNFSIGPFQMKPTFAERIEQYVSNDQTLSQYNDLIIRSGSAREIRYERVQRLSSLKWQLLYLSAFIEIAKNNTKKIYFKDYVAQLKYWATLYNAGIDLKEEDIYNHQNQQKFPRIGMDHYNYADACVEFYSDNDFCNYLR